MTALPPPHPKGAHIPTPLQVDTVAGAIFMGMNGMTRMKTDLRFDNNDPEGGRPAALGLFLRGRSIEPRARLQGVCECGVVGVFQVGP